MKDPHDVIIRPVISEKSFVQSDQHNTYVFVVASNASKPEIRDAVETVFEGVKVANVNTLNRKGKRVRNRRKNTMTTRPTTKRAIVTLSEGEIDVYSA